MILEFPNYVSEEDVAFIRGAVGPLVPDGNPECSNRTGRTIGISGAVGLEEVDSRINTIMVGIQEKIKGLYETVWGSGDSGYEYHRYSAGETCKTHADGIIDIKSYTANGSSNIRYASVVIHLTTNLDGELVFPKQNRSIKTEAGKVVVFPPDGTHRHYTTPAAEDRDVIVTWFTIMDFYAQRR
jgi:predicted 2-oxoglutarate/Fe(II)-dependent dioxygenase YbiX